MRGFDPKVAAEFEADLHRELRATPANRVVDRERVAGMLGRPLDEVARAADVRFVLSSTIDTDIDAVSFRWQLFDAVAGAVVERGVGAGDLDNMVFLPIETAVGLNIVFERLSQTAPAAP
jgi:hypothetical protein